MSTTSFRKSPTEAGQKPSDFWIFVAAVLLVVFRAAYWLIAVRYLEHLGRSNHPHLIAVILDNYEIGAATLLLIELLVLCTIFGRRGRISTPHNRLLWTCAGGAVLGFLIGLIGPTLTPPPMHSLGIADLITSNLLLSKTLIWPALLILALPLPAEHVFRGWIFAVGLPKLGLWKALFISAVIFAFCWPLTDLLTAFVVGLIAAILYVRSGSLAPGAITNFCATVSYIALVVWRGLAS